MIQEVRRRSVPSPLARLGLGACLFVLGVGFAIVVVGVWILAFFLWRPR